VEEVLVERFLPPKINVRRHAGEKDQVDRAVPQWYPIRSFPSLANFVVGRTAQMSQTKSVQELRRLEGMPRSLLVPDDD
jgi:hypothetical protein